MHRTHQNIELGSRPSNLQPTISNPQNFNYLPQEDEEIDSEPQRAAEQAQNASPRAQNYTFSSKISRNRTTNITILLILCFSIINSVSLVSMVFNFFTQENLKFEVRRPGLRLARFMSENLKADPILDIQRIDEKSICPAGFQPLQLGNWTGTVAGCLCENGDLLNSTCGKVGSEKCKTDIPKTLPIEMYEWKNSIFCVKRALLGTGYLKKAECPSGFQECYPGGCFIGDCPVGKLEIASTGATANKSNNNGEDKFLMVTRTQGEFPLINIQLTFGDIPCFTRGLFAGTIKNFSYPLLAKTENQCDKYGLDSHFSTKLDSQTAYDSFIDNFFPSMTMHLPYFEENAKATISVLSSTSRMKTAKHDYCQDLDEKATQDYFNPMLSTIAALLDVIISWLVFFIQLTCILVILANFASKTNPELFGDLDEVQKGLSGSMIGYIFFIPKVIWSYYVQQKFMTMKGSFEEYLTLGCFEGGQGNEVISDYLKDLEKLEGGFWIIFMYWFANISTILVFLCCLIVKKISNSRGYDL